MDRAAPPGSPSFGQSWPSVPAQQQKMEFNMIITGERYLNAPRETVWASVNDQDVLAKCIPGCTSLIQTETGSLSATVELSIGPVKAKFSGVVTFEDVIVPKSYRIIGEGQGGIAGFARGSADVRLIEVENGTRLEYEAQATVGGKIAQLGHRLIDSTARRLSDHFFTNFAAIIEETHQRTCGTLDVGQERISGEL